MSEGRAPHGSFTYDYANPSRRLQQITGLASASFTYGADGRTLTYTHASGTTSFGYTATGLPTQVTAPGASLLHVYDADEWRIKRQVTVGTAVTTDYSLRSALGASTLSRYRKSCATGALEWTADTIYAGGRLLGAFEADLSPPVVEFVWPSSSPSENVGSVGVGVRVTTATGAALACPVTVRWETPVTPGPGTPTPGVDYTPVTAGILTFPAGTASGAVSGAFVPVLNDTLDEPTETFAVQLTGATSAVLGAVTSHVVSILDDDPPVSVNVLSTSVNENAGTVQVQVQLSAASGHTVAATVATAPGGAMPAYDYTHTSVALTFDPGTVSRTVTVPLVNDAYAEPNETFSFVLSGLTNATAGTIGQVTIVDDDGPREAIDPALPGDYFALAHTSTSDATYLLIYNPHPVAVTARVTYVQPSGKGVKRTYALSAKQRIGLHVNADPFVIANTPHAAVVQTEDAARPLVAELSNYYGSGWPSGEATEGVTPSSTWLFAEGATGLSVNFEESFAIFNPSDEAVTVAMTFYGATGAVLLTKTVPIPAGPGVTRVAVNPDLPTSEHSTRLVATGRDTGQPRGIVAERLMRWNSQIEGHRSAGVPAAQWNWAFAEGGKGFFTTYVAVWNPNAVAATVRFAYRHENGTVYLQDVGVPALGRVVVGTPSSVPAGGFGLEVFTLTPTPMVAERMVYAGPSWTLGHAGPGAATFSGTGTAWRFAEGAGSAPFETYFLVTNLSTVSATVTLTYRTAAGAVIGSDVLGVPPGVRGTVWANGTAGAQAFTTEITSTQAIVAERAMYWPTGSSLQSGGAEMSEAAGAQPSAVVSGPAPYTLTEGVELPPLIGTAETAVVVVGKPVPGSLDGGGAELQSSSTWYGSHLTLGKRP